MRLIYFAPVPWDSYEQRPHYVVREFLSRGGTALWVDPYPARLPTWADLSRLRARQAPLPLARPAGLEVLSMRALPIDPVPAGPWVNARLFWREELRRLAADARSAPTVLGIGRPTALAAAALASIPASWSFYDAMDDFPEFYAGRSRRATARVETEIARGVTRVFASSTPLVRKFQRVARDVVHVANAFDMSLLDGVRLNGGPPRLGFIGCLGGWFDWSLLVRIAAAVAPVPVTLLGPLASAPPSPLPANVELQAQRHQPDAIRALQDFTVGLIPFAKNRLTASVDPIKFYQYRGAGLPIVSSRFGEMARRGAADGTFLADGESPARAIDAALSCAIDEATVQRFRREHTWSRRLAGLF